MGTGSMDQIYWRDREMRDLFREQLKETLLEPTKLLIKQLEENYDHLTVKEKIDLEKLKFSVTIYELEKEL
jgi:hypothetical protein